MRFPDKKFADGSHFDSRNSKFISRRRQIDQPVGKVAYPITCHMISADNNPTHMRGRILCQFVPHIMANIAAVITASVGFRGKPSKSVILLPGITNNRDTSRLISSRHFNRVFMDWWYYVCIYYITLK